MDRLTFFSLAMIFPIGSGCRLGLIKFDPPPCAAEYGSVHPEFELQFASHACEDNPVEPTYVVDRSTIVSSLTLTASSNATVAGVDVDVSQAVGAWNATGAIMQLTTSAGSVASPWSTTSGEFGATAVASHDGILDGDEALARAYSIDDGFDGTVDACTIVVFAKSEKDGSEYQWVVDGVAANNNEYDLALTLVHEFGHCLGLGHAESTSLSREVMYPSQVDGDQGGDFQQDYGGKVGFYDAATLAYIYGA